MVEVKRKDNESHEAMMRRFGRRVLQSQVVARARKQRFHEKTLSKNLRFSFTVVKLPLTQMLGFASAFSQTRKSYKC